MSLARSVTGVIILVSILIINPGISLALDYYVDGSPTRACDPATGSGTIADPWKTISYALSQVTGTGHTIHVAPARYDTNMTCKIWVEVFPIILKNGISIIADNGRAVTEINANGLSRALMGKDITDSTTTIQGFTIREGFARGNGAGIYLDNSSPVITENSIVSCFTDYGTYRGAGIYCTNSSKPYIFNNYIAENYFPDEGYGGAICCESGSDAEIKGNIIVNNWAGSAFSTVSKGSAVYCNNATPSITFNTIANNVTGEKGGAIYCTSNSNPIICNNILSHNTNYAIVEGTLNSDPTVVNNNFFANTVAIYYDENSSVYTSTTVMDAMITECSLNLTCNPYYVGGNDYHLSEYSCCINAVTSTCDIPPVTDYDYETRPIGGSMDLGADEYQGRPVPLNYGACVLVMFCLTGLFFIRIWDRSD